MKRNNRLGGILALIGAVIGMVGHYVLFFQYYVKGMSAESAEPGCEILLKFLHPGLADLGILGAVLFLVSAYGFFTKKNWAFLVSVIGIVCALLASWFINVPFMAASLPPVYFSLFFPYLLIYFLLLRSVEKISWSRTLLGLGFGLAYIFCFMNGVSSTSRIITIGCSDICGRGCLTLGSHARLGNNHRWRATFTQRMDAGCWSGFRRS